jgi:hypothetical protein
VSSRLPSLLIGLTLIGAASLLQLGCAVPFAANFLHAVGADMVKPEYEGFAEQTVAVVTLTDGSQYSQDVVARELSRMVAAIINQEIEDVTLVREDQIDTWRDVNGWDKTNFVEIGLGIKADKVIAIEISELRLREGATLFRGRCEAQVQVIDVASGDVEYTRRLEDYTFPKIAGQDITETTEARFRKLYLSMLAQEIGRSFHPYDAADRFAADSAIASY